MKNKILKAITGLSIMGFILGASAIDSKSYKPAVLTGVCLTWCIAFLLVNRERFRKYGK